MDLNWFPFFLRDFDDGTREMTNEEVGAYLRLLFYQWHYGSVPADRERAAKITGERFSDGCWVVLQKKFVADASVPGDRLVNLRMQKERGEAELRYQRRADANRKNGKRGGLARGARLRSLGAEGSERIASHSLANGKPLANDSAANGKRTRSTRRGEEDKDVAKKGGGSAEGSVDTSNRRARRSRRVPEDYKIGEALGKWVQERFPKVATDVLRAWTKKQLEKFKNHEFNAPRSDWDATFRNWVLTCEDRGDVPTGHARGADDEEAWKGTLKTASIFGLTRGADETREAFTERVNVRNQRRLDDLKRQTG